MGREREKERVNFGTGFFALFKYHQQ